MVFWSVSPFLFTFCYLVLRVGGCTAKLAWTHPRGPPTLQSELRLWSGPEYKTCIFKIPPRRNNPENQWAQGVGVGLTNNQSALRPVFTGFHVTSRRNRWSIVIGSQSIQNKSKSLPPVNHSACRQCQTQGELQATGSEIRLAQCEWALGHETVSEPP